jgi:REP-associated tyrosine transposase
MQMLGRYYVQYFNYSYQGTGTLWEGRYKATLIDSEAYLLICYCYIELNPVRAETVEHPSDYPWSSYRHNALGQSNDLITAHQEYLKLGDSEQEQQAAYHDLFKAQISEKILAEIRESTHKAWVLGSTYFKEKIEQQLNRRTSALGRGGDRKSVKYRQKLKINRV